MQWQQLLEFFGGATAISLVLGYLGKKVIEAFLSGKIESYKNNLEKIAYEHSVKFQKLHSERAESIKVIYEKLTSLDETLHSTLRRFQAVGEPEIEEKIATLSKQYNDFREYYLPRKIFFEEDVCEIIEKIVDSARGVFHDITTLPVDPQGVQYRHDRELLRERHEFWDKARNIHENEIQELKQNLESEFRNMLGINA